VSLFKAGQRRGEKQLLFDLFQMQRSNEYEQETREEENKIQKIYSYQNYNGIL